MWHRLTPRADLARDMIHGEDKSVRASILRPLIASKDISAQLKKLKINKYLPLIASLDFEKVDLHQFTAPPPPRRKSDHDGTSRERFERDKATLLMDLILSGMVVGSEEVRMPGQDEGSGSKSKSALGGRNGPEAFLDAPEDLFTQASRLSLNDKEPPPIKFHFLPPLANIEDGESGAGGTEEGGAMDIDTFGQASQRADKGSMKRDNEVKLSKAGTSTPRSEEAGLQSLSARALLEEWVVGDDPTAYTWKPWRGVPSSSSGFQENIRTQVNGSLRPIRPLPSSPRSRPSGTGAKGVSGGAGASTGGAGTGGGVDLGLKQIPSFIKLPPVVKQSLPTIPPSASTGNTNGHGPPRKHGAGAMSRSSPPPGPMSSQEHGSQSQPQSSQMGMMASTQIVRGPFGGRSGAAGSGAKKKPKKRVGGF